MRELTMGEMRMISECTNGWKMMIYQRVGDDIPDALKAKMKQLASDYEAAFMEYYKEAVEKAGDREPDEFLGDFDEVYKKDHPEFYDIDALIGGK